MLQYKRPHNSETERAWIERFIMPVVATHDHTVDKTGNIICTVGEHNGVMFTAHTDTVHFTDGMQKLLYDPITDYIYKDDNQPLGADDGTGCWLLLEMIKAGVKGTYCFFRGEEKGGIGSSAMATERPDWLKSFKQAIAFDRKGDSSIITHQGMSMTASSEFAAALAEAIKAHNPALEFQADDGGTYTDTKEFMALIPECTNLSVGYYDQHTPREMQDVGFALSLRDAMISIDWTTLPAVREPKEDTYFGGSWGNDWYSSLYGRNSLGRRSPRARAPLALAYSVQEEEETAAAFDLEDILCMTDAQIESYVWRSPEEAAELLSKAALMLYNNGLISIDLGKLDTYDADDSSTGEGSAS